MFHIFDQPVIYQCQLKKSKSQHSNQEINVVTVLRPAPCLNKFSKSSNIHPKRQFFQIRKRKAWIIQYFNSKEIRYCVQCQKIIVPTVLEWKKIYKESISFNKFELTNNIHQLQKSKYQFHDLYHSIFNNEEFQWKTTKKMKITWPKSVLYFPFTYSTRSRSSSKCRERSFCNARKLE